MSIVYASEGTTIKVGLAANSLSVISKWQSITPGVSERSKVPTWGGDSTVKTNRASGIIDEGDLNVSMFYDPADAAHLIVRDANADGTLVYFEITYTSGAKTTGNGYVNTFEIAEISKDGSNLTANWSLGMNERTHTAAA